MDEPPPGGSQRGKAMHRRLLIGFLVFPFACSSGGSTTGTGGSAGTTGTTDQSVLERNKNPSRDGLFVQPTLTKTMAMAMAADTNFNNAASFTSTVTNGANVAASPVYLDGANGAGLFLIPTAGGDVVARKEDGTSQ